jgi:hypothetical protein
MKNFHTREYSINDFLQWKDRDEIILQPKFQRRDVWSDKARSYFMDTVIRDKPTNKIFIREIINPKTRRTIREVVDGQQRLKTIFSYLTDGFKISRIHNQEYGGKFYSELPEDIQRQLLHYELAVDLLLDASDEDVLDVFARLNTYSKNLVGQELLNAKYFGEFKQIVYQLSLEFLKFWTSNKIITDNEILRMTDAELVSDLLIAMTDGIKSKKAIPAYYALYDDHFPDQIKHIREFRNTIDTIGEIMQGGLVTSEFRRIHMFYTLFTSIFHLLYGLPGLNKEEISLKPVDYPKIKIALEVIDLIFRRKDEMLNGEERQFLTAARRATTDASVRRYRTLFVCDVIQFGLRGPNNNGPLEA